MVEVTVHPAAQNANDATSRHQCHNAFTAVQSSDELRDLSRQVVLRMEINYLAPPTTAFPKRLGANTWICFPRSGRLGA